MWYLYLLECRGGNTYAGITNDVLRRYAAHQAGKGARYTRANPPSAILGVQPFACRSSASRAEYQLKRKTPTQKRLWADTWPWPPEACSAE
ncbi:GIY-YIG nuclease family protein [Halomonas sediminis]|uniref:GIY-YIG nuclease family protein n=1 Tax=Vreelandella zhuhanensis TaxID=2684210 RepID=A0A7X3H1I0_9GAMM|nr:GIY-YIG nuclease family protein [Halomonas zhuhanensis]MWJ27878.1 GIY-YIG nuclease family protein [Halomonas zhuhanensis]